MSRFSLAFRCFFKLLFGGSLPTDAVKYLPEGAKPAAALREPPQPKVAAKPEPKKEETPARPAPRPTSDLQTNHRDGALALLALLQREGRLVDFLREGLESYSDGDIGVAVRDIHRGCKKVIDEHFQLEAVMPGEEDSKVKVPPGFDPTEVRLIGKVSGEPPFTGTLRHHGWRVTEVKLPTLTDGVDRRVLAPAEVEIASS
ncbi:MAG TPA: DUF2760 domain-containing protein [Kofleriaceae bacterium]|nr:DUF2760 domain-containing protein [Kofleriaceae bacterium]